MNRVRMYYVPKNNGILAGLGYEPTETDTFVPPPKPKPSGGGVVVIANQGRKPLPVYQQPSTFVSRTPAPVVHAPVTPIQNLPYGPAPQPVSQTPIPVAPPKPEVMSDQTRREYAQAEAYKAEAAARAVPRSTITAESTSENMTPAQFADYKRANAYTATVLNRMGSGRLANAIRGVTGVGSTQKPAWMSNTAFSNVMRATDPTATAGERYIATKALEQELSYAPPKIAPPSYSESSKPPQPRPAIIRRPTARVTDPAPSRAKFPAAPVAPTKLQRVVASWNPNESLITSETTRENATSEQTAELNRAGAFVNSVMAMGGSGRKPRNAVEAGMTQSLFNQFMQASRPANNEIGFSDGDLYRERAELRRQLGFARGLEFTGGAIKDAISAFPRVARRAGGVAAARYGSILVGEQIMKAPQTFKSGATEAVEALKDMASSAWSGVTRNTPTMRTSTSGIGSSLSAISGRIESIAGEMAQKLPTSTKLKLGATYMATRWNIDRPGVISDVVSIAQRVQRGGTREARREEEMRMAVTPSVRAHLARQYAQEDQQRAIALRREEDRVQAELIRDSGSVVAGRDE